MPQMSGLELAQEIREYDKDVILVLTTAFLDYAIEGYRLNVLRFLLKDMLEQLLPECMDAVLRKLQLHIKTITCSFIEGEQTIPIADICYIESQKHKLCFEVTLLGGEELPVPRQRFQLVKEKYYSIKGDLL